MRHIAAFLHPPQKITAIIVQSFCSDNYFLILAINMCLEYTSMDNDQASKDVWHVDYTYKFT